MITAAEILFSITTLQFSFTQAPESMKAVMMAIRMLTNAVGNIIDVVVISALDGVFDHQWQFFFLFAGLMFLDMMIFAWYYFLPIFSLFCSFLFIYFSFFSQFFILYYHFEHFLFILIGWQLDIHMWIILQKKEKKMRMKMIKSL